MTGTATPKPTRRGISDFVPPDGSAIVFVARNDPLVKTSMSCVGEAGIEGLLDDLRSTALIGLVRHAVRHCSGDLIELGVYKGGSAALTACTLKSLGLVRTLHLCDTFEGMPETAESEFHKQFDFADTSLESVSANLRKLDGDFPFRFHKGLFAKTLPTLERLRFCFAHIDADLYESVFQACEFVYPRMEKGGFIVFDDYGAPTCSGAKEAIDKFFADKLEKPSHVATTAYGVRVGTRTADFEQLILRQSLVRALFRAGRRFPFRIGGRFARRAAKFLTAPGPSKVFLGPFVRKVPLLAKQEVNAVTARKILVIRPDTLGDLVLFSPFLRELRRSNPNARIALTVQPQFTNIVKLCPYVDEILAFDHRGQGYLPNLDSQRRALGFAKRELWPREFDLALLPRWGTDHYRSAFLSYFSGASMRVGYSEKVEPERRRLNQNWDSLLTSALDDRQIKHEVRRNSDFLCAVGGSVQREDLELWLSDHDRDVARHALQSEAITERDLVIAIAPGAGHPKRVWRLGLFIHLSQLLVREFGARILVVGGMEDRERGARLKEELGAAALDFTGKGTMRETAALLGHCALMIANDGGPMHLGAAAGAAVIEISCHPTGGDPLHYNSPERFAPWCADRAVLQPAQAVSPCTTSCEWQEAHCILNITVDQVWGAAKNLLAQRATGKTILTPN